MKLLNIARAVKNRIEHYAKKRFVHDIKYPIGKYKITIPSSAMLPSIQKTFALYDRFLPVLAKNLPADGLIIDVGANVGDTLAAMASEQLVSNTHSFICIEPSSFFFNYLKKNADLIVGTNIKLVKELIGTGKISGDLKDLGKSTATVKKAENPTESTHVPLDKIIEDHSNVLLMKSDVDGFDYDVICSAEDILTKSQPILFWENQIDHSFQYEGFMELCELLKNKGYSEICIFDNFGNILNRNSDIHTLKNINSYLYSMTKSGIARTFYYVDVLAATPKYMQVCKNAISEYREKYLN